MVNYPIFWRRTCILCSAYCTTVMRGARHTVADMGSTLLHVHVLYAIIGLGTSNRSTCELHAWTVFRLTLECSTHWTVTALSKNGARPLLDETTTRLQHLNWSTFSNTWTVKLLNRIIIKKSEWKNLIISLINAAYSFISIRADVFKKLTSTIYLLMQLRTVTGQLRDLIEHNAIYTYIIQNSNLIFMI